jgi:regulator of sigma E protease
MLLTFLFNVLAFVFVVGVLIVLHEAGHFLAARALKAPVDVFSIGVGKRLWGFERGGTDYRLSAFPIGGYVRVVGLGPDESDVVGEAAEHSQLLPRWKRALILLAGPVTNVITAAAFLAVAYMVGVETPAYLDQPPDVGWVDPSSPAAAAGLDPGDLILKVDGRSIGTWRDLDTAILTAGGRELQVVAKQDGVERTFTMTPDTITRYRFGYAGIYPPLSPTVIELQKGAPADRAGLAPGDRILAVNGEAVEQFWDLIRLISPHPGQPVVLDVDRAGMRLSLDMIANDDGGEGKIGIAVRFSSEVRRLAFGPALVEGVRECWRITIETFRVIHKLVTRKTSMRQVSGPIDIARISGEAARGGVHKLILFMGLISLQLGIFNLLPIPLLDGGHLTIIAFESSIRRDLSLRVKERILEVGFYLLILLFVVVMFNDIVKNLPENLYNLISGS